MSDATEADKELHRGWPRFYLHMDDKQRAAAKRISKLVRNTWLTMMSETKRGELLQENVADPSP